MVNCNFTNILSSFLEKNIFKGYKNGFFIDVGAHDGIIINNTLDFEKYNNWTGINIEPIKKAYDRLIINRPNCININCAICNYDGSAEFYCNSGFTELTSGLKDTYDTRHFDRLKKDTMNNPLWYDYENSNNKVKTNTELITVNTKKLETICGEQKISHINFLSIDVEGAEFEVIKSINFDKVFIDVIGFENNYEDTSILIIQYLQSNNFKIIYKSNDIFMINNESKFIV